ncbi:MAG: DUF4190 domain-containing protein [Planctomycetes bacterium]|nr:DUF4190 domain-containing protein [Planctomycetota bacterium]
MPPPPYPYQQLQPFSVKAIISMVCGGVSVLFWPLGPLTGIAGTILGFLGMKESKQPGGTHRGWGLALAGLITSLIMFVISLGVYAIMGFAFTMAMDEQERMKSERMESRTRQDMDLIKERLKLYYIENSSSLEPGGPVVKDGWDGGLFPDNHPKVTGKLKLTDLVRATDLQNSLSEYSLEISGRQSAAISHTNSGARLIIDSLDNDRWRYEEGSNP